VPPLNYRTDQLTWVEGGSKASALFIKLLPATAASGEEETPAAGASKRRRNRRALVSRARGGEVDEPRRVHPREAAAGSREVLPVEGAGACPTRRRVPPATATIQPFKFQTRSVDVLPGDAFVLLRGRNLPCCVPALTARAGSPCSLLAGRVERSEVGRGERVVSENAAGG
jgi:hypothetical protein